jgi:serine/threonine protein kinase
MGVIPMSDIPSQDWTWIDAAAARFERAWKTGPRPQMEMFLAEVPEPRRAPLLTELLLVERELRIRAGELPTMDEYRRRFPEHDAVVAAAFDRADSTSSSRSQASMLSSARTLNVSPHRAAGLVPAELANHPDYEIVRPLGAGGMGVVYLAHNRLTGRDEVLKVIGQQIIGQPGVSDRFLREIRAVCKLRHPNIVSAYTAFRCGESIVFAMEYVDGEDLARWVKTRGPLTVTQACLVGQHAALGLQHAHEQGMVHRDIKPGNLMLARQGKRSVIKLLDFGLARANLEQGLVTLSCEESPSADSAHSGLTHTGDMLGTPDFVAPEQIVDSQTADIRADIYSLGCTLYCLLTGRPPFDGTLGDVLRAHRSMEAPLLDLMRPDVPPALADLVAMMLAKAPDDRPQVPADVAVALVPFFTPGSPALKTWNLVGLPGTTQDPSPSAEEPSTQVIEAPDPTEVFQPDAERVERPQAGLAELFERLDSAAGRVVVVVPPKSRGRSLLTVSGVIGLAATMLVGVVAYRVMPVRYAQSVVAPGQPGATENRVVGPTPEERRPEPPPAPDPPAEEPLQPVAASARKDDDIGPIAAVTPPPAPRSDPVVTAPPPVVADRAPEEKTQAQSSANNSNTPATPVANGPTRWEDALKMRGLMKTGTLYTLDEEREFLAGFAEVEPLWGELNTLYSTGTLVEASLNEYWARRGYRDDVNLELQDVRAQIRGFVSPDYRLQNQAWQNLLAREKALQIELNGLNQELQDRWDHIMPESQQKVLFTTIEGTRGRFLTQSRSLRALSDKITARYAELDKDDTVRTAIKELGLATKTPLDLGPSLEFKNRSTRLKGWKVAQKNFSPSQRRKAPPQRKNPGSPSSAKSGARPK